MVLFPSKIKKSPVFGASIESRPMDVGLSSYYTLSLSPPALKVAQLALDHFHRFGKPASFASFYGIYGYAAPRKALIELSDKGLVAFTPALLKGRIENGTLVTPNLKALLSADDNRKEDQQKTFVYMMVDTANGFTKIGRSKNPKVRERTLQSEKPTIEMIGRWEGTNAHEKTLHKMFASKRKRGEWFTLTEEDRQAVITYMAE